MEITKITSAQNPIIKRFKNFNRRKTPELMCVEGVHLHQEYFKATLQTPLQTLVSESFKASSEFSVLSALPAVTEIPNDLMAKVSPTKSPVGVLTIAPILEIRPKKNPDLVIILENLQDPGNLGTILRTSLALGVDEVLILGTGPDIWSPKCLRAGMGAQFYLPVTALSDLKAWADNFKGTLIGTSLTGESIPKNSFPKPAAFIFGNEGQGLSGSAQEQCAELIKIPLHPYSESLNVSSAQAIICYEYQRQQGFI